MTLHLLVATALVIGCKPRDDRSASGPSARGESATASAVGTADQGPTSTPAPTTTTAAPTSTTAAPTSTAPANAVAITAVEVEPLLPVWKSTHRIAKLLLDPLHEEAMWIQAAFCSPATADAAAIELGKELDAIGFRDVTVEDHQVLAQKPSYSVSAWVVAKSYEECPSGSLSTAFLTYMKWAPPGSMPSSPPPPLPSPGRLWK